MQDFFKELMLNHSHFVYIILFVWCIFEGEIALVLAGILAYNGQMSLPFTIIVAGLGAFAGDQMHFYIGRYNKRYITKKLNKQKRKFALAHLLLQYHGWYIVFLQRFMYGFRAIVPISIGITRYSYKKFAFINFISSFCWAFLIANLTHTFGDEIWNLIAWAKRHWYIAIPILAMFFGFLYYSFITIENKIMNKRKDNNEIRINR